MRPNASGNPTWNESAPEDSPAPDAPAEETAAKATGGFQFDEAPERPAGWSPTAWRQGADVPEGGLDRS